MRKRRRTMARSTGISCLTPMVNSMLTTRIAILTSGLRRPPMALNASGPIFAGTSRSHFSLAPTGRQRLRGSARLGNFRFLSVLSRTILRSGLRWKHPKREFEAWVSISGGTVECHDGLDARSDAASSEREQPSGLGKESCWASPIIGKMLRCKPAT